MRINRLITTAGFLLLTLSVLCQTGKLEQKIKEQYTIAGDYIKLGYTEKAIPQLHWLIKNAPSFSASVQSWAIEAFETAAGNTNNDSKKQVLLDSMIIAYKSKAEHFELTELEKNKLAFRYFKYYLNDAEKLKETLPLFKEIFTNPDAPINNNLLPYLYVAERYHALVGPLEESYIMDIYLMLSEQIAVRYANDDNRFKDYTDRLDKSLLIMLGSPLPCSSIDQIALGMSKKDSLNVAKKVMAFGLKSGCGRTDNYMEALKILSRNEPTPGIFRILAQYAAADKNWDQAILNYNKALNLETDDKKKADIHMDLATAHYANYNKPLARQQATKAIELDIEQSTAAYSFIGNLYMTSFDECSFGEDIVQDRAIYLAAYDMFLKANDVKGMEEAQLRFPTREEAFQIDLYDGDSIEVGCWIKVNTILRTRTSN